jgi:hypothetical protein
LVCPAKKIADVSEQGAEENILGQSRKLLTEKFRGLYCSSVSSTTLWVTKSRSTTLWGSRKFEQNLMGKAE